MTSGGTSQLKFDLAKLSHVDRIIGGATVVLFISFFMPWYTVAGLTVGGLTAHGYLYVPLVISVGVIALMALEAMSLWSYPSSAPMPREQALLIGTTISFVLVLIAFLFKPAGDGIVKFGWDFGSIIAVVAAVVAVLPLGRPALAARRGK